MPPKQPAGGGGGGKSTAPWGPENKSNGACEVVGGFQPQPPQLTHCLSEICNNYGIFAHAPDVTLKHPSTTSIN